MLKIRKQNWFQEKIHNTTKRYYEKTQTDHDKRNAITRTNVQST
jgi:hypothetical protein